MSLSDLSLSLFTMIVGAIFGAVLAPIGDAITGLLFDRKSKGRSLYGAFLLFFAANGVWIVGELLAEIFVRPRGAIEAPEAIAVALVFGIAATLFAIGFVQLPRDDKGTVVLGLPQALKWLIIGNILWVLGEVIETIVWELWPDSPNSLGYPALWLRVVFCTAAMAVFVKGVLTCWQLSPSSKVGEN